MSEKCETVLVFVTAIIIGLIGLITAPQAHKAVTGWDYPTECCSNGDCAIAQTVEYLEGNVMRVTTKHGTALYAPDFPRRASPDQHIHGCHLNGRKYCLFVPVET